jgi:hypothetical protein
LEAGLYVPAALVAICVVVVALLAAYAIRRMNPDKLRIYGESKLARFGLEISRSGKAEKPRQERAELEAGNDGSAAR